MTIATLAPAKLNLFLRILDKRADNYHNLLTLFQLLNWGDKVTLSLTSSASNISFSGEYSAMLSMLPQGENSKDNLVHRALQLMQKELAPPKHLANVNIHIEKNIPIGAGMGGGSSNAAALLRILRLLWKPQMPLDDLAQLGATLGADVPLFVRGFSAVGQGIGDVLTPFNITRRYYVLICPNIQSSTAQLFNELAQRRKEASIAVAPQESKVDFSLPDDKDFWLPVGMEKGAETGVETGAETGARAETGDYNNDFMQPLMDRYPQLQRLHQLIDEATPAKVGNRVFLSGTGSTMFVIYDNQQDALAAQNKLSTEIALHSDTESKNNIPIDHSVIPSAVIYVCRGVYSATYL